MSTHHEFPISLKPFDVVEPIMFTFSQPIASFGLTTLDLLETPGVLTLQALDGDNDIVAEDSKAGLQGPSGLDLDFVVSTGQPVIEKALLIGEDFMSGVG